LKFEEEIDIGVDKIKENTDKFIEKFYNLSSGNISITMMCDMADVYKALKERLSSEDMICWLGEDYIIDAGLDIEAVWKNYVSKVDSFLSKFIK